MSASWIWLHYKVCLEIMDSVTVWERTAKALNSAGFESRKYVHLTAEGSVWCCDVQSLRLWKAVTEQGMQQKRNVVKWSVCSKCSF